MTQRDNSKCGDTGRCIPPPAKQCSGWIRHPRGSFLSDHSQWW